MQHYTSLKNPACMSTNVTLLLKIPLMYYFMNGYSALTLHASLWLSCLHNFTHAAATLRVTSSRGLTTEEAQPPAAERP